MKKVLFVLALLAIACSFGFAASGSSSNTVLASVEDATLEVTLDLSETNVDEYYEIGFTADNSLASYESGNIPDVTPLPTLELTDTTGGTNGNIKNTDGSAYVYWIVKSTTPVNISLQTGADMKTNPADTTKIKWTASAGDATSNSNGDSEGAADVVQTVTSAGSLAVGSVSLTVSTVDLLTTTVTPDASYSGTLTLSIAAQ